MLEKSPPLTALQELFATATSGVSDPQRSEMLRGCAAEASALDAQLTEQSVALSRSEILRRTVFDALSAPVVILNAEGEIVDKNRAWREALGTEKSAHFSEDETGGNYLAICRTAMERGQRGAAEALARLSAVLAGDASKAVLEYCVEHRGRECWFALTATSLGPGEGAVVLHEDISNQKQLENEILEASEGERRRVGQELHDGLCQHLAGVTLLAKTLANSLAANGRVESERANELSQLLYSAVKEARIVARGLRPVDLRGGGLVSALAELAAEVEPAAKGVFHGSPDLEIADPKTALHLYRIAQEAVRTALRQGQAREICLQIRRTRKVLELTVEHDGRELAGKTGASVALRLMRYRASVLGGTLDIRHLPGGRTRLRCRLEDSRV